MPEMIAPNVTVRTFPSLADAINAAQQFVFGNNAHHFTGTLFQQGGRNMFSTAMPFERFVQVADSKSAVVHKHTERRGESKVLLATEGDAVDDVADTTNRPVDKGHVRGIAKYLSQSVSRGERYIIPPATLNLRSQPASLFTIEGESTIKPAVLVLPLHARFEITDAQHRRLGIAAALQNSEISYQLLRDSVAVMVTFENDLAQVHQDFADASKTKPIAGSLVAVYDGRLPVNALAIHLARSCRLFRHTVDATSKGSSLSAGSVKVWNTNVLRQFIKYAALNSREGDGGWNKKFVQIFGDQTDRRYQQFRDYVVLFVDTCTRHVPLFTKLAELKPEDLSNVPKLRAENGGQVLMTAPGMNVLGAIAHDLYRAVHMKGDDIEPWVKRLAAIDWSYEGPMWAGVLIIAGKISTSGKAVRDAIAAVQREISLETVANAQRSLVA